ncbi:MAG: hypothetical protein QM489_00725 [Candidatus Izemoplasma sp.]
MNYVAGIDYSMTSPAVCIHPKDIEWNSRKCKFLFFSSLKKHADVKVIGNVFYIAKKSIWEAEDRIKRFIELGSQVENFLNKANVTDAYIEGYAFGISKQKGNRVVQIGENGGILRAFLDRIATCVEVPPTRIKKFASGDGRSDKLAMIDKFIKETGIDLYTTFNKKAASSPIDDLADAYFICKYAHEELNND